MEKNELNTKVLNLLKSLINGEKESVSITTKEESVIFSMTESYLITEKDNMNETITIFMQLKLIMKRVIFYLYFQILLFIL